MKAMHKFLAYALLFASITVQSMDKLKKKRPKQEETTAFALENWTIEVGTVILGSLNLRQGLQQITQDKNFLKLPESNRAIIIQSLYSCATGRSLDEVAAAIRNLTISSIQLDKLINDPGFSLSLTKHYSKKFNTNNETVSQIINTEESRKRLALQEKFLLQICKSPTLDPETLKEFRSSSFDLYFTDKNGYTPAEKCIIFGNIEGLKVFLDRGVNPELLLQLTEILPEDENIELMIKFLKMEQEKRMKKNNQ